MKKNILGICFGGHDTSAALMIRGDLISACEEERYNRDKHTRAFPINAINDCLKIGNIRMEEVDEIAVAFDPELYIKEFYLRPAIEDINFAKFMANDIDRIKENLNMKEKIRIETGYDGNINYYSHHLCHLAGAYYPSGFDISLLMSNDGLGEYLSGMIGLSDEYGNIKVIAEGPRFPHSLGLLYSAVTYYLGWRHHCDEGIIMGLASYGNPYEKLPTGETYYEIFKKIIISRGEFEYFINPEWIEYHKKRDTWISEKFVSVFGPRRMFNDEVTQHHKNIAAALQSVLEELIIEKTSYYKSKFNVKKLCISGGVGLNCSLNGAILKAGIFEEVYVQPAAGDAGTAIGACFLAAKQSNPKLLAKRQHNSYLGYQSTSEEIESACLKAGISYTKSNDVFQETAIELMGGKIVAWYQGGAEFGPRALGNRSILCKPYPIEMRDHLNKRVKFREIFRPFAPAVLSERAREYFELQQDSPHMLYAVKVLPEKKHVIPAVVHVDNTCRVQTVTKEINERFYKLIKAFELISNIPVLLNTSFNVKGMPIVNRPDEAISCFMATNIDVLVMGDYILRKSEIQFS